MEGLEVGALVGVLLSGGMVAAVPLTLAALGETIAERAGLLNLGIEGMMLVGAFVGFYVALNSGSLWAGLLAGAALGLILGLLFGVLTITLAGSQVVVGLAITIFAAGLTGFLFRDFYGTRFPSLSIDLPRLSLPFLSSIPVAGPALFRQQVVVYLTWALVVLFAFVLARTRFGLELRAVGENPFAADAAGISVARLRYSAIAIGGFTAGLGGAFLSVADLGFFVPGMTVGTGFIAIAITMLGRWQPLRVFAGALLFGLLRSLATGLQIAGVAVRPEFLLMIPYLGIIVALVVLAGRTPLPGALGVPYERGRR